MALRLGATERRERVMAFPYWLPERRVEALRPQEDAALQVATSMDRLAEYLFQL